MNITDTVVPSWIAVTLGAATLCLIIAVVLIGLRAKRSRGGVDQDAKDAKALRRLFIAAVIPTLGVIGAVMAISFVGLASFAEHDMGWHSWIRFIVPISLDGISITFGFWAFVAVKRGRHPGRAEKIVLLGAAISAWINFNHGRQEWTGAAGIYLGFLSLASAWMFHELLTQFMDTHDTLPKARRNGIPIFGERWIWAPWSTFTARRAWIIYPPAPDTEATVANALEHHAAVKARKAGSKHRQDANDGISRGVVAAQTPDVPQQPTTTTTTTPVAAATGVVSERFLPLARSAMHNHMQATGRPISTDELAARMNINTDIAAQLLATLGEPVRPVLNGHAPAGVIR